jgi:hypothetical protein
VSSAFALKKDVFRSPSFSQSILDLCFIIISSLDRSSDILDISCLSLPVGPKCKDDLLTLSNSVRNFCSSFLTDPKEVYSHAIKEQEILPRSVDSWLQEDGLSELLQAESTNGL